MQKDILFSGVTLTPYSDTSPDGQLAVSHGFELYNGSLRPSFIEQAGFSLPGRIISIHATAQYRHVLYITDDMHLMYYDEESGATGVVVRLPVSNVRDISTVNNVVVVNRIGQQPYYCTWNGEEYNDMGEIPELSVSFSLKGDRQTVELKSYTSGWYTNPENDSQRQSNYNFAAAAVSNFVNEVAGKEGKFVFPFFVRAAWRLFDGQTHIMHTPPVLLIPNSCGPHVYVPYVPSGQGKIYAQAFAMALTVRYQGIDSKWSDVIKGVDIFVSEPLDPFTYDFDVNNPGLIDIYHYPVYNFGIGMYTGDIRGGVMAFEPGYVVNSSHGFFRYLYNNITWGEYFTLQHKSEDIFRPQETANFYLFTSIPVDGIAQIDNQILMPEGYYHNMVFKQKLTDDFDSRDHKVFGLSHVYNSRLSVVVDSVDHFVGFSFENLFSFRNVYESYSDVYYIYYLTSRGGSKVWHCIGSTRCASYLSHLNFLFTPSQSVREVCFKKVDIDGNVFYRRFVLDEHKLLNGRCYFASYIDSLSPYFDVFPSDFDSGYDTTLELGTQNPPDTEVLRNVLNTSAVNNPFYFPIEGYNTVGTGSILAVTSITEALSQGQHGTFPLMAFCTDGNFALKVLSNGLYGDPSPMTRDVCVNPSSITPIEGAVLFVSSAGLMMASGNDIQCISKDLDGAVDSFAFSFLDNLVTDSSVLTDPRRHLAECMYAWDYANKRLLAFVSGKHECLVRSMSDASWSSMSLGSRMVVKVLNVYPYSYVQYDDNSVVKLFGAYAFDDGSKVSGCIITRPIKLDSYQLKRLSAFALQGVLPSSANVSVKLYASHDCITWDLLGTTSLRRVQRMKGRWYKYLRFVIQPTLSQADNLSAIRLLYDVRQERNIR